MEARSKDSDKETAARDLLILKEKCRMLTGSCSSLVFFFAKKSREWWSCVGWETFRVGDPTLVEVQGYRTTLEAGQWVTGRDEFKFEWLRTRAARTGMGGETGEGMIDSEHQLEVSTANGLNSSTRLDRLLGIHTKNYVYE